MGGWTLRNCVSVGVCAVVLAATDGTAQVVASKGARSSPEENVVVIPQNWRETYPFSARFPDTRGSKHVIDLAAVRFATDGLVAAGRGRTFREPDLATFDPSQLRQAFATGGRDLFIVQATDAKAQVTLRRLLQRSRTPILGYIPRNAYLVRLDERARSLLAAQAAVLWIGLFQPAYRVAPDLEFILQADPAHELKLRARFDGEDFASEEAVRAALAAVPDASVVGVVPSDRGWIARVDGPVTLARALATLPGCLWVERFREIHMHNNVARTSASVPTGRGAVAGPIMDVEDVWARGIHGEGQVAAASDTGLSTGDVGTIHADFGDGSAGNPVRVTGIAENDRGTWDDDYLVGGGHGTHTSGSIVGNGIRSGATPSTNTFPAASYAGIAPKAGFIFQSLMQSSGSPGNPALSFSGTLYDLFLGPYGDGARVHSNSWGTDALGAYDALSQDLDSFVWDHPDMVVTFSAGNSGADADDPFGDGVVDPDSIASPGTAKNGITVGASESYRPGFAFQAADTDTCDPAESFYSAWWVFSFFADPIASDLLSNNASGMAPFSSRGPTDDSRIKPDLVAPGAAITSTRTDQNPDFEQWGECEIPAGQQQYYVNMGGTSMSNPLTAGAATLVRQYYVDGWHANGSDVTNPTAITGSGFNPSAALVKATLINGAWDMAPGQYGTDSPQPEIPPNWDAGHDLPNNAEGYGRIDLEGSLFPDAGWGRSASRRMHVRDVTTGLATDGRNSYPLGVGSSSDSLVATLVWSDPYADTAAAAALVNDLDLEVTSPSGRRYTVNRVDTHGAAFVHDTLDNVEQVKVSVPETGQWTVDVVGTSVPGNAVPGTDAQPYALVLSAVSCAVPATPLGLMASANGNNRIDLIWTSTGAAEYHVYRGTAPGAATSLVATVTSPGFTDTTVAGGFTYYYVVKSASGAACESAASAEASATAQGVCALPPEFAGVASVKTSRANCGVDLEWAAATAPCGGPVTYSVYRSTTQGFVPGPANRIQAGLTTTSITDSSGLDTGTTYYYVVRATDEGNGFTDENTVEGSATPVAYLYGPEDFEALADGDGAGWTVVAQHGSAADWRGVQSCGGKKIFRFGGELGCADPYAPALDYNQTFAQPPAIAVPAGATNTRLSFSQQWSFEAGFDGAYLAVSLDGATYTQVPSSAILQNFYNGANTTLGFPIEDWESDLLQPAAVSTLVDLDAACNAVPGNTGGCAGKTLYVAFVTVTDWFDSNAIGWFIDDVRVTAAAPGACTLAPQPVPFFTARSASTDNLLEWQNPASGGYGSAVVRFRTDGTFPTSVADGTGLSCPGQSTALGAYNSCPHSGLANGTTYSYSLFVDNGAGVRSLPRTVAATPFDTSGPRKWAYSTGAASLAPPGVLPGGVGTGAVFALSNDRALHGMNPTTLGGSWPRGGDFSWFPALMNAPAQHRPPAVRMADKTRIFLASQDGYAYAVDAHTGAPLWTSAKLGDVLQANPAGLFSDLKPGAPDLLFVGTRNATSGNKLYALNPSTGATVTSFDNGGGGSAIGIITGIAVDYTTERVYFTSRGSGTGSPATLWCLDASTGTSLTKVWSLNVGDTDGSPILYQGRIYVGTNAGEVKAIDPTGSGTVKWTYAGSFGFGPVKGYVSPQFGSTPLRLFYSTTGRVWAINAGDTSASPAWSAPISNPSTPLHVIGTTGLLVGSSDGTLYQLSTVDGGVTGSVSLGTSALGSPARDAVNGLIHVGSTAGVLHTVTLPLP
jgi:subtilase family protein/putative pyrroloquinoline-quinone binding quinoprotein